MNETTLILITSFCAFIVACTGTYALIGWLKEKQILDIPDERTNHKSPTPRGGGLAVIGAFIVAVIINIIFITPFPTEIVAILLGMFCLALISWCDDAFSLSFIIRLALQILIVGLFTHYISDDSLFHNDFLSPALTQAMIILAWVWFINLYNFMDGIDGITAIESVSIALGIAIISFLHTILPQHLIMLSSLCIASLLGFLIFNWHPAKIFLGDVGSIPLGFLLGYMLLILYQHNFWAAAFIIPAYYLFDSSYTLCKRLLQKKKIWQAHSEHFYQRSVRRGKKHSTVVYAILFGNIALISIAVITTYDLKYSLEGVGMAALTVWGILIFLMHKQEETVDKNATK